MSNITQQLFNGDTITIMPEDYFTVISHQHRRDTYTFCDDNGNPFSPPGFSFANIRATPGNIYVNGYNESGHSRTFGPPSYLNVGIFYLGMRTIGNAINSIVTDQISSPPEDPVYKITVVDPGSAQTTIDSFFDVTIISPICYAGTSTVSTPSGTKIVSDVKKGDMVLNSEGNFVQVVANLITSNNTTYILFEKDCLGTNIPDSDFYVTDEHPLRINGETIIAHDVVQGKRVNVDNTDVYSIATENNEWIKVNNLDTGSWKYNEWLEYSKSRNLAWKQQ